jgi:BirA family biotin operon repressor/biotin-[acetyl-CoA-carboxylase] ligase
MVLREEYTELPSTQDRAIELARAGAPDGTRVVARAQTAGRGRLDHAWNSPEGGLYVSVIVRDPPAPGSMLPLAVGTHLLDHLSAAYRLPLRLKWPNDLLVLEGEERPRKIAGVLVDRVVAPGGAKAVVGIGVNVRWPDDGPPSEIAARAAALAEFVHPPPSLVRIEEDVAASIDRTSAVLASPEGSDVVRRRCEELLYGLGRRVSVDGRMVGRIQGVGAEGELWVDSGGRRVAIRAGDVSVEDRR